MNDNTFFETIRVNNRIRTHGMYHLEKRDSIEYPRYIKSYGIKIETRYPNTAPLIDLLNYSKLFFKFFLNGFVKRMYFDDKAYHLLITIDLEEIDRCIALKDDKSIPIIYENFYEVKNGIIDAMKLYKSSSPYISFKDTFKNHLLDYGYIGEEEYQE